MTNNDAFAALHAANNINDKDLPEAKAALSAGLFLIEDLYNAVLRGAAALERMAEAQERSADAAEEIVRRSVPT